MEQINSSAHPRYAYIGCNTVKDAAARKTGNGNGISVYRIDQKTGAWSLIQVCDALPNPGFLVMNRSETCLYSAHGDYGEVSAYAIDRSTGKLTFVNQQPTHGHNSRHLTIAPDNRYIVVNKGTGVAVFPINADGSLAPCCENFEPPLGPAPSRGKDKAPCPHQIVFDPDGRFVIVPDRNLDKIHVYRFDASTGKLAPNAPPSAASAAWSGPRHIAFHPLRPLAYAINETDCTVTAYNWNAQRGELDSFQATATTPAAFSGKNSGSEIAVAPSGQFVFASNRGHDSIAIFSVDHADGSLKLVSCEPSKGRKPRFFALDASGNMLYAANQDSDSIVCFSVDDRTGKLMSTGQVVETGSPTCIIFGYR